MQYEPVYYVGDHCERFTSSGKLNVRAYACFDNIRIFIKTAQE